MITGAHAILYSTDAEADRAFLRDVLAFPHVDVGGGWLIFALPTSELAVHPAPKGGAQELYLMCDDVVALRAEMKRHGVATTGLQQQGWGLITEVTLPGGGKLGVYQPRHASPPAPKVKARRAPAKRAVPKPKKARAR